MKGWTRRGQPLIALAGIMLLWTVARAWGPVALVLDAPLPLPPTVKGRVEPVAPVSVGAPIPAVVEEQPSVPSPVEPMVPVMEPIVPAPPAAVPFHSVPLASPIEQPQAAAPALPRPQSAPERNAPAPVPFTAVPPEVRAARRWSADGWVLLREKSAPGAALVGSGTYGASQAGAVLRYRLAPQSRFDPRAYLRVTTTLSGEDEKEAALGIAVRPLQALPVDLMVEGRVLHFNGDPKLRPSETRTRPAVMAVVGPPPLPLPVGARVEAYAQAGYVGGEGASAFADGQVRVVRDVSLLEGSRFSVDAGLGVWGGAQKDVERLDTGLTVALRFPIGDRIFARAGLDWRQRVAGDAEPGSGPVLTLSAGF